MNWKMFEFVIDDLKITLILQLGRFLQILLLMRVLKSSDIVPRKGKTITKSFFSAGNVINVSVSYLLEKFFNAAMNHFDRKYVLF